MYFYMGEHKEQDLGTLFVAWKSVCTFDNSPALEFGTVTRKCLDCRISRFHSKKDFLTIGTYLWTYSFCTLKCGTDIKYKCANTVYISYVIIEFGVFYLCVI